MNALDESDFPNSDHINEELMDCLQNTSIEKSF